MLASLGFAAACGGTDTADDGANPPAPAFPAQLASNLQASLDKSVSDHLAPGVALYVTHPQRGSWTGAAGIGDIERGLPAAAAGHFRAGSTLKLLVATAVLQQVESGKLALDTKLTELLPVSITKYIARANEIDLRMLLDHWSGIPEFLTMEVRLAAAADQAHIWTLEELLTAATKQPPTGAPGERYSYSNTNYVLLGEILRAKTGRDWRDVVSENVLARAKMTDSSLPFPGDRAMPAPFNLGYLDMGTGLVDFTHMDPSMAGASGGHALVTTPADLAAFLQALLTGKLFDKRGTLDQMLAFLPASEAPESPQTEYGLGVQAYEIDGTRFVGHFGRTAGYFGFTWHVPKTGFYAAGVMNHDGDLGAFMFPIAKLLAE